MSHPESILIDDSERPKALEPLSRFHSFFEWNLAGFTLLEKLKIKYPQARIYYKCKDPDFQTLILSRYPEILPNREDKKMELIVSPEGFLPWDLQRTVTTLIEDSLSIDKSIKKERQKIKSKSSGFHIVGKEKHLYLHPTAVIYPGVVFDTTNGPIIIDKDAKITSFSFLEGPLYIGKGCSIDSARIAGGSLIGNHCRVGGEVENSILLDYTNKHHEGFLGHSFVSSWVNIGALATTSDLKNNYGIVKLRIGEHEVNTGTIKFGSLIAPFSKIAIGVMMNTGCVIDVGSNLVDSRISGYQSPFSWIDGKNRYRLDSFLSDTKKIMARRSINLQEHEENYIKAIYSKLVVNAT